MLASSARLFASLAVLSLVATRPARAQVLDAGVPSSAAERAERGTVVTGTRTERRLEDAVIPTEVIGRRAIEMSGARDLGELLSSHPGLEVVHSFRGAGIRIQGMDPEYVLVLVDGERVSGRVGGVVDLARFSLRDVDAVEILKGPAAALYGSDAIGGVVNLITRRVGRDLEGNARGSFGARSELDLRAGVGGRRGPLELRLGAGRRSAAPYDLDTSDVATSGAGLGRFDVDGAAELQVHERVRLKARADYLRKDEQAIDLAPSGAVFDRRGRVEQLDVSLSGRAELTAATAVGVRLHHSLFRDQLLQDQRGAVDLDQYSQSWDRLYEAVVQVDQRLGSHQLTGAAEYLYEGLLSERLAAGRGARQRVAVLAQDEWAVLDRGRLVVLPGLRYDVDTQFGQRPSPRLAVRAVPVETLTLRAAYGWGFRSPSFQELYLRFENPSVGYVVDGNPALGPEKSQGLNVSADFRAHERLTLSASVFRTEVRDLVDIVTVVEAEADEPTRFSYGNVARARTQGFEASARVRVLSYAVLDLGYAFTDAYAISRGRPLEGRPRHRGTFQLTYRHRPTRLDAMVRGAVVGPRPFYVDLDGDGGEDVLVTRTFADLDVQLTWRAWDWLSLFAGGNNLLNSSDTAYLIRPPRGFQAGLWVQY